MLKDHGIRERLLLTAFYKTVSFTRKHLVDLNILSTFSHLYLKKIVFLLDWKKSNRKSEAQAMHGR